MEFCMPEWSFRGGVHLKKNLAKVKHPSNRDDVARVFSLNIQRQKKMNLLTSIIYLVLPKIVFTCS